ncbi:hypothetical protein H310_07264 [Aphanomyces invadans]|uniref:Uncharacterized protein n=1 Tax=Aphanomyces invadans TaxID=157072 RepID=A0A024U474_9STRA|nr:hypothetical protein H310_07264 [Aphanomyces invadans]ETW00707.1 hypothetical protein H310_07264 [Aphanomyces invadans]|eukprot:XP_008870842.1 hypothetical protein H310_07264 [Aphanomyces invadans]
MVLNIAAMITRFEDLRASDQAFLEQCLQDFAATIDQHKEVVDTANPVFDKAWQDSGDEGIRTLTNFTRREFDALWSMVEVPLKARWHGGRGAKPSTSPKDALLMTMAALKPHDSWEKHALDSNFRAPTFQKLNMRVIQVASPVFYDSLVKMPSMAQLAARGARFANHPYALYATDVKFQPCERPGGRHGEAKPFFSAVK